MSNFDEKAVDRIKRLEREVERLRVKESPDMSSYSLSTHDHDSDYLGITAKATDSDKLDGLDSTAFGRPVFLTTPLTSTAWDGDSFSTTSKTLIDLSAVFSAPAGIKAVMVNTIINDSASSNTACVLILSPNSTNYSGIANRVTGLPNDYYSEKTMVVPCDANGDVYYQIVASGTGTMDVTIQIWGYWL